MFAITLAGVYGVSVEQRFGEQLATVKTEPPPRDPEGRKLYILMVDSLTIENAKAMPSFSALGENGFRTEIQPCFDNFTTACVREMLTGRRVFSLFAVLENFQVTRPGIGDNLMEDARNAGLSTALLSWGDLRGWSKRVDTDHRFKTGQRDKEAEIGLKVAAEHDIVFHHWIWHDVTSHHHAKKRSETYAKSLVETNALIEAIARGLPDDMDLIVTGDHGHTADGRHVQGMDVPTVMVARSPNLKPIEVPGRTPITALRFLMGAITGLGSHASQVKPEWNNWLSDTVGPDLRNLGHGHVASADSANFPSGPMIAAALLGLIACISFGWKVGLTVCIWMGIAGFMFPDWLAFSQGRGLKKIIHRVAWSIPLLGALIAFVRTRSLAHVWLGTALGSLTLCIVAWPGLFITGVLRNTNAMLVPITVIAGLITFHALWKTRSTTKPSHLWLTVSVCIAAVVLAVAGTDFSTNHFRIRRLPVLWMFKGLGELKMAAAVGLGIIVHRMIDPHSRWAVLGGVAVVLGATLPTLGGIIAFTGITVAWWSRSSPWRARFISFLGILITGYTLTVNRQLGVLLTLASIGLSIHVIRRAAAAIQGPVGPQVTRISTAMVLLLGGFVGLAWTTKLKVSGVDFTFAVDWLPGRLHKELWWIVASATILNCFLPLILAYEIARSALGQAAQGAAVLAARVGVLRFIGTIAFTTGWMLPMGDAAASSRLQSFLQDGFIWLGLGTTLAVLSFKRPPPDPEMEQRVAR